MDFHVRVRLGERLKAELRIQFVGIPGRQVEPSQALKLRVCDDAFDKPRS